ncbi:MAG: outer membrane lipoprotein LolB [Betaproteobacteria bacterium]|nr:outer membrane lipoprotein LolB [Betaproteobacteria bacterium]MBI2959849.1 outer membrane lipoprotein LolB [Betaproteobacteria bacterium]
MTPAYRLARSLVLLAAVAGCTALPTVREADFDRPLFELAGRVAVQYGAEGASARLTWRHGAASDDLLISSPLGQGIARLTRRGGEVQLVTSDATTHRAADAESLTEQVLGWRLPLAGLPDWVQGRPDPARPAELARDASGRATELRQDRWRIEYQEYEGERPSRLRLTRDDLEIRLVVDQWMVTP